jgi:hypothetical protein
VGGEVRGRRPIRTEVGKLAADAVQRGEPSGGLGFRAGPPTQAGRRFVVESPGLQIGQRVDRDGV